MPVTLFRLAGVALAVALSGCASLSENECRTADWRGIGLQDGLQGKTLGELEEHRRACAEYTIAVSERPYLDGREEGLREFCRLDNAFRVGLNGQKYLGVCPPAWTPTSAASTPPPTTSTNCARRWVASTARSTRKNASCGTRNSPTRIGCGCTRKSATWTVAATACGKTWPIRKERWTA